MILYYSSTGNSKYVAQRVHRKYGGQLVDLGQKNQDKTFDLQAGEVLYLVTFNCFWGLSNYFEKTLLESQFRRVEKVVFIITCGGYLGSCDIHINSLAQAKGWPQPEIYSLTMVTNYTILHGIPTLEKRIKQLDKADKDLDKILQGKAKPYKSNFLARLGDSKVRANYKKYTQTAPFQVSKACISCGKCQDQCPTQAIELQEGRPVWVKETCDNCLKCLHHCPSRAINYGESTKTKIQYTFEKARVRDPREQKDHH